MNRILLEVWLWMLPPELWSPLLVSRFCSLYRGPCDLVNFVLSTLHFMYATTISFFFFTWPVSLKLSPTTLGTVMSKKPRFEVAFCLNVVVYFFLCTKAKRVHVCKTPALLVRMVYMVHLNQWLLGGFPPVAVWNPGGCGLISLFYLRRLVHNGSPHIQVLHAGLRAVLDDEFMSNAILLAM